MSNNIFYISEIKRLNSKIEELQKNMERNSNFWFSLVESIPVQVYLQAKDYSIEYANKSFVDLYGEYQGKMCYSVIHGRETPCEYCRTFEVFENGKPQIWEDIHGDGKNVNKIYDYPFVNDKGDVTVLEMGIDITESYSLEKKRQNLFTNVSHELRTPMTKIMGYSEAMMNMQPSEINPYAECIYRNAKIMSKLIDDLFELTKVEIDEHFNMEVMDVKSLLDDFLEEQELYYEDLNVVFTYSVERCGMLINTDVDRLIQVLSNLIENACNHRGKGNIISVDAKLKNKSLLIQVFNDGNIIDSADLKYLFDRYYQVEPSRGKGGHLGIGLSICKNIVEKMHGEIWAENVGEKGVMFSVKFPLINEW